MSDGQLDLFSVANIRAGPASPEAIGPPEPVPADLADAALVAAIPDAGLAAGPALAAEAGRRRLVAAVPALEALCRRFAGFGMHRLVPEQAAALQALEAIGGREAAQAVGRMLSKAVVVGPALNLAVAAAAGLRSDLPVNAVLVLLRHADPGIRAEACGCVRPSPDMVSVLSDLLDDLDDRVARSAACALGRMGKAEARAMLVRLLREEPSDEVIAAVSLIADEERIVLLGRIARTTRDLADCALDALDGIDHPRAISLVTGLRGASAA